nr:hypothetical protein [Tanacetum cinerariifolium]
LTTQPACHPSLVSCLPSLGESLPSMLDAYSQSLKALASQSAASGSESRVPGPRANKHDFLRGGNSVSGISSIRSTGGGMYRGGGSGGSGGDGNAAVTTSIRAWVEAILSVWIWVGHPNDGNNSDGTGDGDECADEAVYLARRSLQRVVIASNPSSSGSSVSGGGWYDRLYSLSWGNKVNSRYKNSGVDRS